MSFILTARRARAVHDEEQTVGSTCHAVVVEMSPLEFVRHHATASKRQFSHLSAVMQCIYNGGALFDWDTNNLRKIRAHRIKAEEVEKALSKDPIPIYEQDVEGEVRYVYYGETDSGRLLAVVLVERGDTIRVGTAYDLDAGQKKDYLAPRLRGE